MKLQLRRRETGHWRTNRKMIHIFLCWESDPTTRGAQGVHRGQTRSSMTLSIRVQVHKYDLYFNIVIERRTKCIGKLIESLDMKDNNATNIFV